RPELDSPRRRVAWSAGERPGAERAEHRRAEEVLRQFRNLLHPTLRNATLNLEPRELGKLSIRISMHEGQLAANVRAERPETLELLKKHLPELRAALAAAGIQTQSLDLELGAQERGDQPGPDARRRAGAAGADASFEARVQASRPIAMRGEPALDTWA
ncbi:MAG: flagellar hook-length control protein FliK, partial [Planctomycetota bacterium]